MNNNKSTQSVKSGLFIKVSVTFRESHLLELKGAPWCVLTSIGLHMNGDNLARPTQAQIARETGYSLCQVKRTLKFLEARGYIKIESGVGRACSYRVNHGLKFGLGPIPTENAEPQIGPQVQLRREMSHPPENLAHFTPKFLTPSPEQNELPSPQNLGEKLPYMEEGGEEEPVPESSSLRSEDSGERRTPPSPLTTPREKEAKNKGNPLSTPGERREYVAAAANRPAALGECFSVLFPKEGQPPPGSGRKCPYIGRLGRMAQAHGGWAGVLEDMEHAVVDQGYGRVAVGDILSWIEGRLRYGKAGRHSEKATRPRVRADRPPEDYETPW